MTNQFRPVTNRDPERTTIADVFNVTIIAVSSVISFLAVVTTI